MKLVTDADYFKKMKNRKLNQIRNTCSIIEKDII